MFLKSCFSLATVAILAALAGQAHAASICPADTKPLKVKGTIFSNAVSPGTTLGIAHLKISHGKNLRCGILGSGGVGLDGTTKFVDQLVCDDSLSVANPYTGRAETVHSQLTLNTSGTGAFYPCVHNVPAAGSYGTFDEISTPISGRGRFQGVKAGLINNRGTINCQFGIDMEFEGEVCLPQ